MIGKKISYSCDARSTLNCVKNLVRSVLKSMKKVPLFCDSDNVSAANVMKCVHMLNIVQLKICKK